MSATTKQPDEESTRLAMRKSCDFCYFHKKRCDGDGVNRCRRCTRKGEGHPCIYSHRKRKERRRQSRDSIIPVANSSSPPDGDVNIGTQPFKRYSLSPSPATGLVGLRENTLLSDFFACVGFLPFTSHSRLLQSMMGIMIRKQDITQAKGALLEEDSERDVTRPPKRALCASQNSQHCGDGRNDDPCRDPSTCVFWCAIAIGGLAKGQQLEEVARYTARAKAALEGISGPATVELARAWTILAYTYGLGGDIDEFNRYLQWAHACLRDASRSVPNHDIQVGFAELVEHRESVKRSMVDIHSSEVEELCSQNLDLPEISDFATEGEMYRFFMHTYRALEQAFFLDLSCHKTAEHGVCTTGEKKKGHVEHSISLNAVITRLRVCLREFERLENAVDRPHIQKSVGGFMINCILVFVKSSKGDVEGALQRSTLCIEFLERFPGFCSWLHTCHILASVLATMSTEQPRARQLYEALRAVYNPAKGNLFPSFPPIEEWSEHTFHCDNFYCSSMIWAVSSREFSFSSSQRCSHKSPPFPEKILETIDNHSDGFTTEIHEPLPLTSFGLDGSASRGVGIRAVSPTSSIGTDEAWQDPLSKADDDGRFAVELGDDAVGGSEFMATVVPSETDPVEEKIEEKSRFKLTAGKVNHFSAEAVKVDVCKTEPWKVDTFIEADTDTFNVGASDVADAFMALGTLKTEAPEVMNDVLHEDDLPPNGVPYLMSEEADELGSSNWLESTFAMLEANH